ncbi:Recombinase family protein (plasmid) [Rhodovastum atsumiense]|uniref:Recombinase family protein n=1 Tax=Rhodovastum atsumiense TaxID=504468 RepID=A0A5M6IK14_9PROT|nr:recombinase family protein [Rhodovastum atsumiense]KAA5607908.1 recombinase family protein [Rhodovastum atsumiense]CAH2605824.1 Recombinase family protein [Rhodovastum atsumiense]
MSEAELHILKARMLAGKRAKARRGELGRPVPMGYVQRASGEIAFDPDEQAEATIRLLFELFDRFHTIGKVLRYLVDHDIRLPVRVPGGARKGELEWHRANRINLHNLFANPIYAGAYVYGLRPTDPRRRKPGRPGTGRRGCAPEQAEVFLPDHLPAYISWEHYQRNRAQLRSNQASARGVARAGESLLSGLIICGKCGLRMVSQYNNNGGNPRYACNRMTVDYAEPLCQTLKAAPLDALMEQLVLAALEPAALDASILAAGELQRERAALEAQWHHRLERAAWQAERARRQYHATEPENRLVARTLEREWEQALAAQAQVQAEYERFQREQPRALCEAEIAMLRAQAGDLPGLWHDATQEERQTLVRLLLERVLVKVIDDSEQVEVVCHWHGGHQTMHRMVRPVARLDRLSTYPQLLSRATELRQLGHGYGAIAERLNDEGWRPPKRRETFNASMVSHLLRRAGVTMSQYRKKIVIVERQSDEWTIAELARQIPMPMPTLYNWVQEGRLRSRTVCCKKRQLTLVYADAATISQIRTVRATPAPWRRRPAAVTADAPPIAADPSAPSTQTCT